MEYNENRNNVLETYDKIKDSELDRLNLISTLNNQYQKTHGLFKCIEAFETLNQTEVLNKFNDVHNKCKEYLNSNE